MATYRKIATIEAVQFLPGHPVPDGVIIPEPSFDDPLCQPYIQTLEGKMFTNYGCWIATGPDGEHWSIYPDIFARTYTIVED